MGLNHNIGWLSRWIRLQGQGAIALFFGLFLTLGICPSSALATTWYPVAEASQGQQQFVDIDSLDLRGAGLVRVGSYYVDSRSGAPQRTTYLTEYDCPHRRFRDLEFNGPMGSRRWMPVDPDPLNVATMEYVCAMAEPSP